MQDLSPDDEELLKFIERSKPKIYIVGAGGSGSNTINRLYNIGVAGATLIAMNTDAAHLLKIKAHKKLLLGKKSTRGLGAGSDMKVGEEAAMESKDEIKELLRDAQMVFITCGLGGGTGTGSAHVIAKEAKDNGALVTAIVTLPFSSEGKTRMKNALEGLNKLRKVADATIIIKNDKLLNFAGDMPLNMAFRLCDEVLANATKGIVEMITKPGMVNIDFADLKAVLKDAGYAVIGIGEAYNAPGTPNSNKNLNRGMLAIDNVVKSPLLDIDLTTAKKALVHIIGGESLTLREAESIVQEISSRISKDALLKFGARIDTDLQKDSIRIILVLAGVNFPDLTEESINNTIKSLDEIDKMF
ncbi:MAG: cell division protein FtsZ [Candidatus Micrarchaeota archaeon]|nr:MAG: cell division protein FtsZ [Candidatus Micrarchaeota archaeon]